MGEGRDLVERYFKAVNAADLDGVRWSPQGEISPTGKSIELKALNAVHMRDGRMTALHIYFDQIDFMGQLGLLPG